MQSILIYEILPALIFFILFALFFSLLELILIFILNHLSKTFWEWVIDVVIRADVHHGKIINFIVFLGLGLLTLGLVFWTPFFIVLKESSGDFKIFALLLPLLMALIYLINLRQTTRMRIAKKIYSMIFFVVSLVLYVLIILTAHSMYGQFNAYAQKTWIQPVLWHSERISDKLYVERLLKQARQIYLEGKCLDADYTTEKKAYLMKNLFLVSHEPGLAFGDKKTDVGSPAESLKGKSCSDGKNTFLLTPAGDWYWVSEEYLKLAP